MMMVTPSGVIKSANRTTFKTLGYFEDTLTGKPFSILLNPSTSLSFEDLTKEVRMQKTVLESVEFLKADGSICPMDMTVNLVPWDRGMMVLVNLRDVTERVIAEKVVKRREAILKAVSHAADEFLKTEAKDVNINEILRHIGSSAEVDCAFIFKNHLSHDGELLSSMIYEWVAKGIEPQIDNPAFKNASFKEKGFNRWANMMLKGEIIHGDIKDFLESEQIFLTALDVRSIIAVPIFAHKDWWGFIGFAMKRFERKWSGAEIETLRTASDIIGSAIYRSKIEELIKERIDELERFRKATIQREFRIKELQDRVMELEIEVERLKGEKYGD
jgi:PAS domain S-box-containing protein